MHPSSSCLCGWASCNLGGITSGVNYTTHNLSMVLLDFHRELRYAKTTAAVPRLMIKTALHVVVQPPAAATSMPLLPWAYMLVHRLVFFVINCVRALVETSTTYSNNNYGTITTTTASNNNNTTFLFLMLWTMPCAVSTNFTWHCQSCWWDCP